MSIDHVLAVVPVSDIERARQWYAVLFGRPEDNHPMDTLVEWRVTGSGWVQVFYDPQRAGSTLVNFGVADLEAHATELAARGVSLDEIVPADKGVTTASVTDPDGNRITFIGGFRIVY